MSDFLAPGLPRFCVNLALAALTLSFVGWVLTRLLRRAATEWRLLAVQVTFALLLLSPALIAFEAGPKVIALRPAPLPTKTFTNLPEPQQQVQTVKRAQTFQTAAPVTQAPVPPPAEPLKLTPLVLGLWALLSSAVLVRLFLRSLVLRAWLHRHATIGEGNTYTADIPAPFCGGIFRPFLVLPRDFDQIPQGERQAVVEHEVAHLRLKHPLQQFLAEIACAVFGWIPFVAALRTEMKDLHEQQGDESVLRLQQDGFGLAQGLVRFAERLADGRVPASALSIVRNGSRLEARIQRLVESRGIPMKPKKSLIALGAATLAIGSAGLACTLQMTDSANGPEVARFLPFKEGAVWTYEIRRTGSKPYPHKVIAWSLKNSRPDPVMEFYDQYGRDGSFTYWRATAKGLSPVDNVYLGGMPGFRTTPLRTPRLPSNAEAGYTWKWQEEFRGQTMSRFGEPPPKMPPTNYDGKIVAVDEPVTVPAGSYKATVVEIKLEVDGRTSSERTYWVKDVGRVKTDLFDDRGKLTQTETLQKFTPGIDPPTQTEDLTPLVQYAIGKNPALVKLGKARKVEVLSNPELEQSYRSRFAVVTWKTRTVLFHIRKGGTTVFDPTSLADWNALRAEEGVKVPATETPRPVGLAEQPVSRGIALLVAASKGYSMKGAISRGSATTGKATGGPTVTNVFAVGTQENGEPWSVSVQFKSNRGKVTEIHA